jgi:hypothetical protein
MNTQQDDGGPAFPFVMPDPSTYHTEQGMSLRDYFAAAAMQGILAADVHEGAFEYVDRKEPHSEWVPPTAYAIADAMIRARNELTAKPD